MADGDRIQWETRYAARASTAQASAFLRTCAPWLRGRVLDVAAGSGRNALWLARNGATVDAIDISHTALRRAQHTAHREGLRLHCLQADLETYRLPADTYDGIVQIRYLQRSLFPSLRQSVRRGGVVLIETFLLDQQRIGHPRRPEFLLRRGELASAFSDFEMIHLEENHVIDDGQPAYLARMLARRI